MSDKRAEELAALHAKLEAGIPGMELPPDHPPKGLALPKQDCEKCNGHGWAWSERYERYLICPCTIHKHEFTPSLPYRD
jgi:hypothetical protein